VKFEFPSEFETKEQKNNRIKRLKYNIKKQTNKFDVKDPNNIPDAPPLFDNNYYNNALDCIRSFELEQMNYSINTCDICHETRIKMTMSKLKNVCQRCFKEKSDVKMFSVENNMDPGEIHFLGSIGKVKQKCAFGQRHCRNHIRDQGM
jgi:hypothetical protein